MQSVPERLALSSASQINTADGESFLPLAVSTPHSAFSPGFAARGSSNQTCHVFRCVFCRAALRQHGHFRPHPFLPTRLGATVFKCRPVGTAETQPLCSSFPRLMVHHVLVAVNWLTAQHWNHIARECPQAWLSAGGVYNQGFRRRRSPQKKIRRSCGAQDKQKRLFETQKQRQLLCKSSALAVALG